MLLVKTKVLESTIPGAGRGLFLEEDVSEGTVFGRFDPSVDRLVEWDEIEGDEQMLDWCYYEPELKSYIYCSDDARFINHSCELFNYITNEKGENIFIRDMKRGEEILANYCAWNAYERGLVKEMLRKNDCACIHSLLEADLSHWPEPRDNSSTR